MSLLSPFSPSHYSLLLSIPSEDSLSFSASVDIHFSLSHTERKGEREKEKGEVKREGVRIRLHSAHQIIESVQIVWEKDKVHAHTHTHTYIHTYIHARTPPFHCSFHLLSLSLQDNYRALLISSVSISLPLSLSFSLPPSYPPG